MAFDPDAERTASHEGPRPPWAVPGAMANGSFQTEGAAPQRAELRDDGDPALLPGFATDLADGIEQLYHFLRENQREVAALRREVDELQRSRATFASIVARVERWLHEHADDDERAEATCGRVSNIERELETLSEGQSPNIIQRVEVLERQGEVLSRIIDLIVERSKDLGP